MGGDLFFLLVLFDIMVENVDWGLDYDFYIKKDEGYFFDDSNLY